MIVVDLNSRIEQIEADIQKLAKAIGDLNDALERSQRIHKGLVQLVGHFLKKVNESRQHYN